MTKVSEALSLKVGMMHNKIVVPLEIYVLRQKSLDMVVVFGGDGTVQSTNVYSVTSLMVSEIIMPLKSLIQRLKNVNTDFTG